LADAPEEIRELVSLRKDTLSHAYELMKVEDPKRRRRLTDQVARGELTLIKLRDRIEGRRARAPRVADDGAAPAEATADETPATPAATAPERDSAPEPATATRREPAEPRADFVLTEDSLVNAKALLADALDELVNVLRSPDAVRSIADVDRANLAKYLTIAKLKLENAIAIVRTGDHGD
jgi:hypothetical protein